MKWLTYGDHSGESVVLVDSGGRQVHDAHVGPEEGYHGEHHVHELAVLDLTHHTLTVQSSQTLKIRNKQWHFVASVLMVPSNHVIAGSIPTGAAIYLLSSHKIPIAQLNLNN